MRYGPAVPEALIVQAEKIKASFLVLGVAGLAKKLGSVTKDIISQKHASTLAIVMHKID